MSGAGNRQLGLPVCDLTAPCALCAFYAGMLPQGSPHAVCVALQASTGLPCQCSWRIRNLPALPPASVSQAFCLVPAGMPPPAAPGAMPFGPYAGALPPRPGYGAPLPPGPVPYDARAGYGAMPPPGFVQGGRQPQVCVLSGWLPKACCDGLAGSPVGRQGALHWRVCCLARSELLHLCWAASLRQCCVCLAASLRQCCVCLAASSELPAVCAGAPGFSSYGPPGPRPPIVSQAPRLPPAGPGKR